MRLLAVASDYDGTLASDGKVSDFIIQELENFRSTGHRLILVTGRILVDLMSVFPRIDLFDMVVAENGALIYRPSDGWKGYTSKKIPKHFIDELKRRGVDPLEEGEVIVATREPNENLVLNTIRDLGLELDLIFNKGAVMILPAGINKGSGLNIALKEMRMSRHNVVAIGDAENDHAFLQMCEGAAAVANALTSIKERSDLVMPSGHGTGVLELMQLMKTDQLDSMLLPLSRRRLIIGAASNGNSIGMPAFGPNLIIVGPDSIDKTILVEGIVKQLIEQRYQFCLFVTDGRYEDLEGPIQNGGDSRSPDPEEIIKNLEQPECSIVVNLSGLSQEMRQFFLSRLLPGLYDLQRRYGRPHHLLIDDAHLLVPSDSDLGDWRWQYGAVFITAQPKGIATSALRSVDILISHGDNVCQSAFQFAEAVDIERPSIEHIQGKSRALLWNLKNQSLPVEFSLQESDFRIES
jgi:HAD superfamily hydrolase (TIGR01484 family)